MNNIRKEYDQHYGDFDNHAQYISHANNASELHANKNTHQPNQTNGKYMNHTVSDPDWAQVKINSQGESYERGS